MIDRQATTRLVTKDTHLGISTYYTTRTSDRSAKTLRASRSPTAAPCRVSHHGLKSQKRSSSSSAIHGGASAHVKAASADTERDGDINLTSLHLTTHHTTPLIPFGFSTSATRARLRFAFARGRSDTGESASRSGGRRDPLSSIILSTMSSAPRRSEGVDGRLG
jgi:hypothetical protein